ncbi:MAG: MFS transporter [Verrucomicrobia bacterium]|nr:MFS transporter [Verrucomicrobiota bacterium]
MTPSSASQSSDFATTRGKAWLIVGLLWVIGCLNYLDRIMMTTMRDSIKAAIPMGDDDFGLLLTVFLWVYGFLSPVGGWAADRFGRSRVILLSLAVWSAVTLATAFVTNYWQLLLTRVFMGVSEACYIPAALALIADYHRGPTRSLATGIHMSGIYAGMALGGAGGWMAQNYGWQSAFVFFGAFGVVYAVVLVALLRDVPSDGKTASGKNGAPAGEAFSALGRSRPFWLLVLNWGLLGFAGWAIVQWLPAYLREHFHLDQAHAGVYATAFTQVAAFCGVLVGGAAADRWSRTHLRGRIFVPMIALTVCSPAVLVLARTDVLAVAVCCLVAYGFARGTSDANMMPILCQVAEPRHRATGYGILNFFSCIIGGLAPYLGGWLKERHVDFSYIFMGSALIMLVSGLFLTLVKPTRRG